MGSSKAKKTIWRLVLHRKRVPSSFFGRDHRKKRILVQHDKRICSSLSSQNENQSNEETTNPPKKTTDFFLSKISSDDRNSSVSPLSRWIDVGTYRCFSSRLWISRSRRHVDCVLEEEGKKNRLFFFSPWETILPSWWITVQSTILLADIIIIIVVIIVNGIGGNSLRKMM